MSAREEVVIIGSGPAGYSAAIYAARAGLNPLIVAGPLPGGQLINTLDVGNWPGDSDGVLGPELMERMKKHCENLGVRIKALNIIGADFSSRPLKLLSGEETLFARSIILATGASPRTLELPDESKYFGKGISTCATCDGFFFKGQEVAVVGGGNVAAEEAIYLAKLAKKVRLIHRRDKLRADKILQDTLFRLVEEGKIEIIWDSKLVAYQGDEQGITGAILKNKAGEEHKISVQGIFIAIGHDPNSVFLNGELSLTNGYVSLKNNLGPGFTATSVKGVFAAGDIADHHYRQAVTSAGMGAMAALDAISYLQSA